MYSYKCKKCIPCKLGYQFRVLYTKIMYEEKKTCVNLSAAVFTHFYHIITQEAYALFIRISNPDFHTYDLATKKKKK